MPEPAGTVVSVAVAYGLLCGKIERTLVSILSILLHGSLASLVAQTYYQQTHASDESIPRTREIDPIQANPHVFSTPPGRLSVNRSTLYLRLCRLGVLRRNPLRIQVTRHRALKG